MSNSFDCNSSELKIFFKKNNSFFTQFSKSILYEWRCIICAKQSCLYTDGLMQKRYKSITNALELHLSCTNPSIQSGAVYQKNFHDSSDICLMGLIFYSNLWKFSSEMAIRNVQCVRWFSWILHVPLQNGPNYHITHSTTMTAAAERKSEFELTEYTI